MFDISIVIALYNSENTILRALDSIFTQELENIRIEVVIVDDGSKDNGVSICMNSNWARSIKLISLPHNHGQAQARNLGIRASSAPKVLILDADDVLVSGSIVELFRTMECNTQIDLVFGNRIEFGIWGTFERNIFESLRFPELEKLIKRGKNPITHSGTLFRKEWFLLVGGYDSRDVHAEDLGLWRRGLSQSNFYNIDLPTVYYQMPSFIRPFSYWQQMEISRRRLSGSQYNGKGFQFLNRLLYMKYFFVAILRMCSKGRLK